MGLVQQPVAAHVRALMMSAFLRRLAAPVLFRTDDPTEEHLERTGELINKVSEHLKKAVEDSETGMARAMRFSLFPEERDEQLMETFAHELSQNESAAPVLESRQFCALAEALDVQCHGLDTLRETIGHA